MRRRHLLSIAAAAALLPRFGRAEGLFDRQLRFVVPYAPGGAADTMARMAAEELAKKLGQQVIVDNRPGGGTMIGTEIVAKAKPDAHTLLLATGATAINSSFGLKMPYDPAKDLVPVVGLVDMPCLLVANNQAPFQTVLELISWAKKQPGTINFASSGNGSIPHLWGEQLGFETGMKLEHIGYKGSADAMKDVMGGHVNLFSDVLLPAGLQVKNGHLRGLVVAAPKRSEMLPDVPTLAEAGLPPDLESSIFFGVVTATGAPAEAVAQLNRAFNEILADPAMCARLFELGFTVTGGAPDAYGTHLAKETARWRKVIEDCHIPPPG